MVPVRGAAGGGAIILSRLRGKRSVVLLGNCQLRAMATLLSTALPKRYEVGFLSNNEHLGDMLPRREILARVERADVLLFHPLGGAHGELAEPNVREVASAVPLVVSIPYLFNSGISGLGEAPATGKIFGSESIERLLAQGVGAEEIAGLYVGGEIDFKIHHRFHHCLTELRRRERGVDLALSPLIEARYRHERTMFTHNHPSTELMVAACALVGEHTGLPIEMARLRDPGDDLFPPARAPISPHDLRALGCTFPPEPTWETTGRRLIEAVARDVEQVETTSGARAG